MKKSIDYSTRVAKKRELPWNPILAHSYTILDLVSVLPFQTAGIESFENGQGLPGRICLSKGDIVAGIDWVGRPRMISNAEQSQGAVE